MPPSEQDPRQYQFCDNCGAPRTPGAAFCGECGTSLTATASPSPLPGPLPNDDTVPVTTSPPAAAIPRPSTPQGQDSHGPISSAPSTSSSADGWKGWAYIGGAIAVFVVCSIVQGMAGSSMFTTTFETPDSLILESLVQLTFWPGWLLTLCLAATGVFLVVRDRLD